jgi:hypothetical protein
VGCSKVQQGVCSKLIALCMYASVVSLMVPALLTSVKHQGHSSSTGCLGLHRFPASMCKHLTTQNLCTASFQQAGMAVPGEGAAGGSLPLCPAVTCARVYSPLQIPRLDSRLQQDTLLVNTSRCRQGWGEGKDVMGQAGHSTEGLQQETGTHCHHP